MLKKHYSVMRSLLLLLTALFLTVGIVLSFTVRDKNETVFAETPTVVSDDINAVYPRNSYVEFPQSVYVAYGSNSAIPAEFLGIRLPDGSIYAYNSIEFTENGVYQIIYSFTQDGKTILAEKEVSIQSQIFEPFISSSTVEYGTLEKFGVQGLNLTLSAGDVFTFNKPINVYESDLVDIITLYPEMINGYDKYVGGDPSVIGADCLDFKVSLTDAHDPSNVVILKMGYRQSKQGGVRASVISDHGMVALIEYTPSSENNDTKNFAQLTIGEKYYYVPNESYLADADNKHGLQTSSYVRSGFTWQFGGASNQIIIQDCLTASKNAIVEDLDCDDITTVTGKFRPFTTGEVYVSIYGERWQASSTKIQIKAIGNYSGEELLNGYYIDDKKPIVNVDVDMQGKETLVGVTYNPIKVYNAQAFDISGVSVKTCVYYNYGTSNQTRVNIVDGAFTPTAPGKYSIVYVATDNFGNSQCKEIPVTVINPKSNSTFGEGIDILNVNDVTLESILIGEEATLLEPEFLGYNGQINYSKSVIAPDGSQVALKGNTFLPVMLGNYTINYNYYDNVYNYTYTYQVTCNASSNVFFAKEPSFLKYYTARVTYKLDDFYASYVENGTIKNVVAELYAKFDDGEYFKVDTNNFEVEVAEKVTFKYKYGSFETAEYQCIVVDVNYNVTHGTSGVSLYKPENYFYGNFNATGMGLAQRYESSVEKGNNTLEFINPLLTDDFSFTFKIPEDMFNYEYVVFKLTDVNDPTNTFSIKQYFETWRSYVQYEDTKRVDTTLVVNGKFDNQSEKRISYKASSGRFTYNNSTTSWSFYPAKEVPQFAYFSIEFVGIKGKVGIDALLVGTDSLVMDKDISKPLYSLDAASGYYNYGSDVVLKVPVVSDIFSPVSIKDVKITVTDASGNYVTSKEGVTLNRAPANDVYTVTAISDSYKVLYTDLIDGYGNKSQTTYSFYVADFDKPVISFNDGSNEDTVVETSVGKEVTIKEFTVTDNKSSAEDIQVVITIVNMNYYNWVVGVDPATMVYKTTRAGHYRVNVSARDEAGNFQVASYQLIVK